MLQRWSKLERDFRMKSGRYDISKIPDIYDCIKYDTQHNSSLDLADTLELFRLSRALADIVIPQVKSRFVCFATGIGESRCSHPVAAPCECNSVFPTSVVRVLLTLKRTLPPLGIRHQQSGEAGHRSGVLRPPDEEDPAGPAEDARGRGRQQTAPAVRSAPETWFTKDRLCSCVTIFDVGPGTRGG